MGLLYEHHGHADFVRVPDQVSGDSGLEGYSRSGYAYQCYAPQECVSEQRRYEKIRDKINVDLNKLVDNQLTISSMLGGVVLTHWFLVTPDVRDKRLLSYANTKAMEVRKAGVTYIDTNFEVTVINDHAFPVARKHVLSNIAKIPIKLIHDGEPLKEEVDAWADANQGEARKINEKIDGLASIGPEEKDELKKEFAIWRLKGEALMAEIQTSFPEQHQELLVLRSQLESQVKISSLLSAEAPDARLSGVLLKCKEEITTRVPGLSPDVVQELMQATAAYWMVRCPLSFRSK